MKVKLNVGDRELRDSCIETLRERSGAELIQRVGNIALLFLKKKQGSKFAAL